MPDKKPESSHRVTIKRRGDKPKPDKKEVKQDVPADAK